MSRIFRLVHRTRRLCVPVPGRGFHDEFSKKESEDTKPEAPASQRKYKVFRDEDSTEILDVQEERYRYQTENVDAELSEDAAYSGLNLQRGLHGVFEIEDLVDVLRRENADDIFVCTVPRDLKYVDFMVICSGRSNRHMLAIAEFVRHIFKKKRSAKDILPRIEGKNSRDWMALDLGNIALHIFSPSAREIYDLESLWTIGSELDKESNRSDPLVELYERNSTLLKEVKNERLLPHNRQ